MSTESISKKTPWQFQALPSGHLHPLTFLRPDVVLHVHSLWASGRHNETTLRSFALPDCENFRPFYMMGMFACMDYIKSWRITPEDVELLLGFESVAKLPAEFSNYLVSIPGFTGCIKALPDGNLMTQVQVSSEVRELYGDKKVELNLVVVEGPSAEVALISEALAAIIDFSVSLSADMAAHKMAGLPMMYYETERELHPYWAQLAATIESIIANEKPLNKRLNKIWLWSDEPRDPSILARVSRVGNDLSAQGYDVGVLGRKEIER